LQCPQSILLTKVSQGLFAEATFDPAMRTFSVVLLLHFLAITVAPAWITLDFLVERDRIEKDLCVQRMVADGQRTCHGECYLMKRLKKSEGREQNLPNELRAFRIGDMIALEVDHALISPKEKDKPIWAKLELALLAGHTRPLSPVPWY
jgi:hypothetical protein